MVEAFLQRRPLGPVTPAVLSFLWPGLGQLATGRRRYAAILAIPAAILVLAILSRLVDRLELAAVTMLDPSFSGFVFFAVVALAGWRSIAVIDAWRSEVTLPASLRARQWLAGLLVAIALSHAVVGYYVWSFYDAGSQIFTGDGPSPSPPAPTPTLAPGETPAPPTPTPGPTAPPSDRISILLTGIDSGHDRNHALTDTMLVISTSPSKGTVAMVSFPRDLAEFQLYSGGTFHGKLNALRTTALLNGRNALAYVRSRMGAGDNDFTRANRQQQLILALKDKLASPATLAKLPELLQAAGKTVQTNVPPEKAHDYIELADSIDPANITRVVLGPPYAFHPPTSSTGGIYILLMNEAKIAELAVELFGTDSRYFGAVVEPSPTR